MKKLILVIVTFYVFIVVQAQTSYQKIDNLLKAYYETGRFNGSVLVAEKDKFILKKGYGYKDFTERTLNDANTLYQVASITKTFTAGLILRLIETGKISLNEKLNAFYPGLPSADHITIEQLLTHTSGISDKSGDTAFNVYRGNDEPSFIAMLQQRQLDFAPGSQYAYSNAGYILLGYIAQKITGDTYYNAIRRYIFTPSSITRSGFDFANLKSPDRATGYWIFPVDSTPAPATLIDSTAPRAAGAIYSNVADLYKWHRALQSGGLISAKMLEAAFTSGKHPYGYGWVLDSLYGRKIVSHGGDIWGFQSLLIRVPQDDVCIILLSNVEEVDLQGIGKKITAILYGRPYLFPARNQIDLTDTQLNSYIGDYEMQPGMIMHIERRGKQLWLKTNITQPMYSQAANEFLIEQGNDQKRMRFEVNDSQQVVALVFEKNGKEIKCLKR